MRPLLLLGLMSFAFVGCRPGAGQTPYLPGPSLGSRIESVVIPEGYDVQTASFGASYATSVSGDSSGVTGGSYERPFVNVFAVEVETGRDVLLVYALGRRSEPVLFVYLDPSPPPEAPPGESGSDR
ncbi:MAG: hypothetical protein AAGK21_08655 [Bacteroidota bacterium]